MPRKQQYQILIDRGTSMEDMASWLMLAAAGVFDDAFPDQWDTAMGLLAEKIAQHQRDNESPKVARLRVVDAEGNA